MKRALGLLAVVATLAGSRPLAAQPPGQAEHEGGFTAWAWYQDVRLPDKPAGRLLAIDVPSAVFARAQTSLNDLRLGTAQGRRVPYALRVERMERKQQDVPIVRQFNAGPVAAGYYQVTLELRKPGPPGYNEIVIDTPDTGFSRKVEVFGSSSDDFKEAPDILLGPERKTSPFLVHYDTERGVVDIRRLHFGFQQYRFLQVRVYADAGTKEKTPTITHIAVRQTIALPGRYRTEPARLGPREFVRGEGGAGTAWYIDLGAPLPVERLSFQVAGEEVNRPFRLEVANPDEPRSDIAPVDWQWHHAEKNRVLEASFPEVVARRLRLTVTDFANPPLNLVGATYTSCVRAVLFEPPAEPGLRLYYGNPEASAPRYDLAQKLPAELTPPPLRASLGEPQHNPDYVPPPQPLSERYPWLVYVVLGAACACLLVVLALLARLALARAEAAAESGSA